MEFDFINELSYNFLMIVNPIREETLNLFFGRKEELEFLEYTLGAFGVAIIEGDFGIGKTSVGNYFRLSNHSKFLTPEDEISTDFRWTTKEFLHEVLKYLLDAIIKDEKFLKDDFIRSLLKRYNYLIQNSVKSDLFDKILSTEETESLASVETVGGLIQDLKKIVQVSNKMGKEVLVQLNNLDLSDTSDPKELLNFFATNRDIFQKTQVKWILTGSIGLTELLKKNISKVGNLFIQPLGLGQLDVNSVILTLEKRGLKVYEQEDMVFLCNNTDLRELINKFTLIKDNKMVFLKSEDLTPKELESIKLMGRKEWTQDEAEKLFDVKKSMVSKRLNQLIFKNWLIKTSQGKYRLSFEGYCSTMKKVKK